MGSYGGNVSCYITRAISEILFKWQTNLWQVQINSEERNSGGAGLLMGDP